MVPLLVGAGAALAGGLLSANQASNNRSNLNNAVNNYQTQTQGVIDQYNQRSAGTLQSYMNQSNADRLNPNDVNAWLNPNINYQMEQVRKQNNAQYGAQGMLNSGAAMKSLQDRSQNVANQAHQQAVQNAMGQAQLNSGITNNQFQANQGFNDNLANAYMQMHGNALAAKAGNNNNSVSQGISSAGQIIGGVGTLMNAFK